MAYKVVIAASPDWPMAPPYDGSPGVLYRVQWMVTDTADPGLKWWGESEAVIDPSASEASIRGVVTAKVRADVAAWAGVPISAAAVKWP